MHYSNERVREARESIHDNNLAAAAAATILLDRVVVEMTFLVVQTPFVRFRPRESPQDPVHVCQI